MDQVIRYIYQQVAEKRLNKDEAKTLLMELQKSGKTDAISEDIAVVGMACKFPGADDLESYWTNIESAVNYVRQMPKGRLKDIEVMAKVVYGEVDTTDMEDRLLMGGYLDEVDKFDAGFFKITPREAKYMDPLQRIFLETAWEAVESAGYSGNIYGSHTGVYVGKDHSGKSAYPNLDLSGDPFTTTGSWTGILASRMAYIFNLTGPSVVVDTACSSGLVAIHLACKALLNKDCDMAIAGGIHLSNLPIKGGRLSMVESEDGLVKTFDKHAGGTVWGEGCGAVLLKPLSKALLDGDCIHAVIKGSAINNDGASNGITAPSAEAQEQVIIRAWEAAKVDPETIGFIEAHATATMLGDPIEIKGLTNAFRHYTEKKQFCGIGSVKSEIGHLVGAAGLAGFIKTVLILKNRMIPANINFEDPNPYINFVDSPIYVPGFPRPWEVEDHPRRAGVSAFGFSGTNAHVIVEEAPAVEPTVPSGLPQLFTLSARSREVLSELVRRYARFFNSDTPWNLDDLCFTASVGKGHYSHRLSILAKNEADLLAKFARLEAGGFANLHEDWFAYGEHRVISDSKSHREPGDLSEGERKQLSKAANLKLKAVMDAQPVGEEYETVLTELAGFYIQGADLEWEQLFAGQRRRRLLLPLYPLERTRYWLEPEIHFENKKMGEINEVGHPLFDACLAESVEQVIYSSELSVEKHWVLSDHIVAGSHIVPGTTYLEMARLVAERHYPGMPMDLRDVIFLTPLEVVRGEKKMVHTVVKVLADHLEFIIASKLGLAGWQRHVEGKIFPLENRPQAVIDLKALFAHCTAKAAAIANAPKANAAPSDSTPEGNAAGAARSVFEFGPRWRNHFQVVRGGDEILVELGATEISGPDLAQYGLHPALLDNAVNAASQSTGEGPYLPLIYKSFKIYGNMPNKFYTHLKRKTDLSGNLETITFDISLCDENGQVFAYAEDYSLKRFRVNEWKMKSQAASRHYYEIGWVPAEPAAAHGSLQAKMLLIKDTLGIADALQQKLEAAGVSLVVAEFGNAYSKYSDTHYTIQGEANDYAQLFSDLQGQGIGAILHLGAITGNVTNLAELKAAENRGIYSIFRLTQAYFANKFSDRVDLVLITDRAHAVSSNDIELHPHQTTLAAIGKTINAENSNLICRTIDLDLETDVNVIIQELITPSAPYQVAYRHGVRYAEEFRKLEVEVNEEKAIKIQEGGVYLITGGAGGLGLEFAKHFAAQGKVRLALTNRSPLPERNRWAMILEQEPKSKLGKRIAAIQELEARGAEVTCFAVDVSDPQGMQNVLDTLRTQYGKINGIVHAAGVAGDGFLMRKSEETFASVLRPKIDGTWILHELTRADHLDFYVLFSSINSLLAGAGQSDYAAANAYLDAFAAYRNAMGERTVAINWPAWKETGMAVDFGIRDDRTSFKGITTARGLAVFEELLSTEIVRAIPAELNIELMATADQKFPIRLAAPLKAILDRSRAAAGHSGKENKAKKQMSNVVVKGAESIDQIEMKLARIWGNVLELPEVDIYDNFYDMGGDSLLATKLAKEIKEEYPTVDISDIFTYPTVAQLSEYIKSKMGDTGTQMLEVEAATEAPATTTQTAAQGMRFELAAQDGMTVRHETVAHNTDQQLEAPADEPLVVMPMRTVGTTDEIAIIGMACKLPGASNPDQYWANLKAGVSLVTDFPLERRKDTDIFIPEEMRSKMRYFKGGYLDEVDKFDADFFNITPREASLIEPTQRLFLQTAMEALEDAGYSGNRLYGTKTGVFAGRDHANESYYRRMIGENDPQVKIGSWSGILSSRLSYFMNFRGPSIVIDTACSSGLVAVHQACASLRTGECTVAVAGGVNVFSLPLASPAMAGLESPDGVLRAFDEGANGTVWGEGVGVVILKPLHQAQADGDQIYAVIKGSAINNDGASNGLTAPSALAQEEVIVAALNQAGVHPETISYLEAHGTATAIGDPIEIKGITNAYRHFTNKKRFCAIGAVKTNIGHTIGASGVASLIKVVLSLKNGGIPASLNYTAPNPHINFEDSPVYVNAEYQEWPSASGPRRAAISSFGFSGTNAHMIVEEAPVQPLVAEEVMAPVMATLSARNKVVLGHLVERYQAFVEKKGEIDLRDLAFTTNTGRGHYSCRLAIVTNSYADFKAKIAKLAAAEDLAQVQENGIYYGEHKIVTSQNKTGAPGVLTEGERRELSKTATSLAEVLRHAKGRAAEPVLAGLCDLYIQGANLDWDALYANQTRKRVSLPVYPFERKRLWVEPDPRVFGGNGPSQGNGGGNTSTGSAEAMHLSQEEAAVTNGSTTAEPEYCQVHWIPGGSTELLTTEPGNILIFADEMGISTALRARYVASHRQIIEVRFGEAYAQTGPNSYTIAGTEEEYHQLLTELKDQGLTHIFHLATMTGKGEAQDLVELSEQQKRGLYSLYYLSKAVISTKYKKDLQLVLISQYGYSVTQKEEMILPEHAAFYGLGKGLMRELPFVKCRAIDLDGKTTIDELVAELAINEPTYEVAIRDGQKYVEELTLLRVDELACKELTFSSEGAYLITGGTGGIGIEYAKFLAQQQPVQIALISRSGLPPREEWESLLAKGDRRQGVIQAIQEIERTGSVVRCYRADVADLPQMQTVIEAVRQEFGRINGVFHAAGITLSGVLATEPEEDFNTVVTPKIQGTWILDHLTRQDQPDFFLLCSSIASILSSVGLGDYTAANLYLNSYAAQRRRQGYPTLALNWSHWIETGLALNFNIDHTNAVFESLLTAEGHAYFASLTSSDLTNVFPARLSRRWIPNFERTFTIRLAPAFLALAEGHGAQAEVTETAPVEVVARRSFTPEETMETMQRIWREAFGYEEIGPEADFFEIGGNSLIAMNLISKIAQTFCVTVALEDFLRYTTVQELVTFLIAQTPSTESVSFIKHVENQPFYPVSSAQKRILVINQLEEGSIGYNLPSIVNLSGDLDLARFENAFHTMIQRHESLRTSFDIIDGEPVQIVHDDIDFHVTYQEASEGELRDLAKAFVRPFNLKQAPLMRVGLIKYAEQKHLMLFDMHHIISDGTSLGIVSKEFNDLYNGRELAPIHIQYRDYAVWQNELFASDVIREQETYWLNKFTGPLPVLALPTDYPRPAFMSFVGQTLRFEIDRQLTEKVNRLARDNGATPYIVLLTAYNILLAKYAGQEDIIVGSPIAGRHHADLEKIIGMFINSLVMRNYPVATKTVSEFLEEVKTTVFEAFNHQDYPFEMLVDKLRLPRDLSRNPLFDTMFALHNFQMPKAGDSGLTTTPSEQYENTAIQFDLQLQAYEAGDYYRCTLEFSTALFKQESMQRFINHYVNIVRAIVENPSVRISEIAMITPEEREHLIYGLNQTTADFSRDRSIYQLFEEHVANDPDKTALIFGEERISYAELNQRANCLARVLQKYGATTDLLVGILMERSPRMVESILATWKAGAGYIPLDPEYPIQRLAGILNDSEAKILVTLSEYCSADLANEYPGKILLLDTDTPEINSESGDNLNRPMDMNSLAYVIYTSGSTGKPKGAMVEHIGMMNHIQAKIHDLCLTSESIVAQNSSHCFDISVWQFFVALTLGGTTVIYSQEQTLDPQAFVSGIIDHNVTILEVVPSYLSVMLDYLEGERRALDQLTYLLVTGEIVKPNLVKRWFALYPEIPMVNAYGPTEASDDITHFIMTEAPERESIPIGRPVQNFHIYMVDQNMQLCPVGVKGEICVSGVGVGRGYLNNPEKTQEAFTVDPFVPEAGVRMYKTGDLGRWLPDGTIEFFGRKDYQVKIRGFRIELGEIETKLVEHPEVKESVVVDREDQSGNKYLCAYITVKNELDLTALKQWLLESLPEYMVPAYFVILETLPLNANGKVDRKALPEPGGQAIIGSEYVEPRTEVERRLAKIWSEVLGVEKVGINDNFFEIGGNSIKLITLAYKLNQEFSAELEQEMKVIELFRLTTIRQLAEYFEKSVGKEIQEYTL